ncbi:MULTISPECIES: delta-class carbonic anhydrase [Rhodobacterales]|uniref:delta-class carbonic anhydrase n=1 Tax=Rhodobacterales TaxID=204455 RepID=UPI00237FB844|nr:delta-class carbonic anhydrase [Phaeobacter gallaeciensis]MDE4140865.1 delta-class carbonic anhydrase [Phaeobacter gallaeciensis]MDE4149310.1 delta-class carbonic anhydrase [Phaeobacter gallaeciensis]MDE4153497.1 delta-class carbonic anhydrase [Phaeobacter gallaeciensis]MDE4228886.1 delta-class carbonic anhydrase [Phaeobacter gallaeciensis]MDE4257961.1 delta-class carbonic anhydrase [Phaeobacter gallaeciensis]
MTRAYLRAVTVSSFFLWAGGVHATSTGHGEEMHVVPDAVIAEQRQALSENTLFAGFGPQAPRDIDSMGGSNKVSFEAAPPYNEMNLCNIHFHESAEHRGGEFTTYAGNGDGHGYGSGYKYSGELSVTELAPYHEEVGATEHGSLVPGDTIEVHFVHTTARVDPGPTLGSCLSEAIKNPQLRVEAQVFVLVNDETALDFTKVTRLQKKNGLTQAVNMPTDTGRPVVYAGSTTGPGYNEKGSPFQVTWAVRPKVAKVSIQSVARWLDYNTFDEDHAHGVRNLVINPDLLSVIGR